MTMTDIELTTRCNKCRVNIALSVCGPSGRVRPHECPRCGSAGVTIQVVGARPHLQTLVTGNRDVEVLLEVRQ